MISLWCLNMMILKYEMSTINKIFWIGILEILIYFDHIIYQYFKLNIKKLLNEIIKLILNDHR